MKIGADYGKVLELKGRIAVADTIRLTEGDINILRQILNAAEGSIFPSQEETDRCEASMRKLAELDPRRDYKLWNEAIGVVRRYENKYC